MCRHIRNILACMALLLTLGSPAFANDPAAIRLENETYTPLHYRVRTPSGTFSDWRKLLPGEHAAYHEHPELVVDIWFSKDRSETYQVSRGSTSTYYRSGPKAVPKVASSDGPTPRPPALPAAPASGVDPFAPLQQFLARCGESKHPCRLSLKKLAADCARSQQDGALPAELRYLRGFTWFVGYLVDEEADDVILLGINDPARPPLDIDCLASAIKCAYSHSVPYCSLEPTPDGAFKKAIVKGVPWNTRWAEVMIFADDDMGRVARGYRDPQIKGLKTWRKHFREVLSTLGEEREGAPSEIVNTRRIWENRFWYNFDSKVRRAVADDAGKLVYLYRNPLRLSTEQKVDGEYGSGKTTESARRFVREFTEHLDEVAQHYPNIAELQGLYRLYDLMRHLCEVSKADPPALSYWTEVYEHCYQGPPELIRVEKPAVVLAEASFAGSENLGGYGALRFTLHANGAATMVDADGTTHGSWGQSGKRVTLRFYDGTVVYHGTLDEETISGTAHNRTRTWSWSVTLE